MPSASLNTKLSMVALLALASFGSSAALLYVNNLNPEIAVILPAHHPQALSHTKGVFDVASSASSRVPVSSIPAPTPAAASSLTPKSPGAVLGESTINSGDLQTLFTP